MLMYFTSQWHPYASLFFLFVFLPFSLFVYYMSAPHNRVLTLAILSVLFFLLVSLVQLLLLLLLVVMVYVLLLYFSRENTTHTIQKTLCFVAGISVCVLFWLSLGTQLASNSMYLLGGAVVPVLAADILIRSFRSSARKAPSFIKLVTYLLFFPRLFLGPLESMEEFYRCNTFEEKIRPPLFVGFSQLVYGLFEYLFVATRLLDLYNSLGGRPVAEVTYVSVLLQIFCLFFGTFHLLVGFSKMSVGTALLFGCRIPQDTQSLCLARGIGHFLRIWHRSLFGFTRRNLLAPTLQFGYGRLFAGSYFAAVFFALWLNFSLPMLLWGSYMGVWLFVELVAKKNGLWYSNKKWTLLITAVAVCSSFVLLVWADSGFQVSVGQVIALNREIPLYNRSVIYLFSNHFVPFILAIFMAFPVFTKLQAILKTYTPVLGKVLHIGVTAGMAVLTIAFIL